MNDRNPAIELYRCVLMLLIVLHHAAYHGCWNHVAGLDAAYPSIGVLFTVFTIWHVDGFLSITGWFGTRFSLVRFAKIWGVITAYTLANVAYVCLTDGKLSWSVFAGGWFGQTYLFFLFLTPVLNAATTALSADRRKLFLAWIVFDLGLFLNWAPYHLLSNVAGAGMGSLSVMTFVSVYVNVRLLKLSGMADRVTKGHIAWAAVLFYVIVPLIILAKAGAQGFTDEFLHLGWYYPPYVMLMAMALLLFFAKFVTVPPCLARIVTFLSPLMFGVYLCHETTLFGRALYIRPQIWLRSHCGGHPLLVILASAILCFSFCIVVEALRRQLVAPLSRAGLSKLHQMDEKLSLTCTREGG